MSLPSLETMLFILGAFLVVVGIFGGGFKVKEIEVPKTAGIARIGAFVMGLLFCATSVVGIKQVLPAIGEIPTAEKGAQVVEKKAEPQESATLTKAEAPAEKTPEVKVATPPVQTQPVQTQPVQAQPVVAQPVIAQNVPSLPPVQPAVIKASFDCAKAGNDIERLICGDADIAAFDRKLAEKYREVGEKLPRNLRDAFTQEEASWIRERNACASDANRDDCIRGSYISRIAGLQAMRVVLDYYADIGSKDVDAALKVWTRPPTALRKAIMNTDYTKVNSIACRSVDDNEAVVYVNVTTKALDGAPQEWAGNVILAKTGVDAATDPDWLIDKLNISKQAG